MVVVPAAAEGTGRVGHVRQRVQQVRATMRVCATKAQVAVAEQLSSVGGGCCGLRNERLGVLLSWLISHDKKTSRRSLHKPQQLPPTQLNR